MFRLKNVCTHQFRSLSRFSTTNIKSAPRRTAVTAVTSCLRPTKSRSRAPDEQTFISRLPAVWHSTTVPLFSSTSVLKDGEVQRKVEDISEKFKEAMELLDDARSSAGTVYFSDDMTDAENAIQEVLSDYKSLMDQMNEDQKRSVVRTIGLKIEELKAQVEMLKDSLKE